MSPRKRSIPEPLSGSEQGTWARHTIRVRFHDILHRTRSENDFPIALDRRLEALGSEIPESPICQLRDHHAPDDEDWQKFIAPYEGSDWLEPPWFFVEHYFYRRILEAVDYFGGGPDPFQWQKERGLQASQNMILPLAKQVDEWLKVESLSREAVGDMIYYNLWGNQADLSLWPADSEETPDHTNLEQANQHLLVDESDHVLSFLEPKGGTLAVVDFLIDNAGFELVSDLAFADLLLSKDWTGKVRFHVKGHPTFVSDAIVKDVEHTISVLSASTSDLVRGLGKRLQEHVEKARLIFLPDFFWNSPLAFWDLPACVADSLSQAEMLISKGDANYRRLMGDRHWSFQTPFRYVVDYLPVNLAALRTLKAEVGVGLSEDQVRRVERGDPDWMVDGRWGVIQFAPPRGEKNAS
jgi:uncharacterized protein with ATP-grasp and redox domains